MLAAIFSCGRRARVETNGTGSLLSAKDASADDMDDPDVYVDTCAGKKNEAETAPTKLAKKSQIVEPEKDRRWAEGSKLAENDGEVAMLRGNTFLLREEYDIAEGAFERAIELMPHLEEAHVGKVNCLRGQRKYMAAFKACREGLAKVKSVELQEMRNKVQEEYQANKKRVEIEKKRAMKRVEKDVDEMLQREKDACPSGRSDFKEVTRATTHNATDEEREEWKNEILELFRDMYIKTTSTEAISQSTTSYSNDLKMGLKIAEGHRHMPRPDNVVLPSDFKRAVGQIDLNTLSKYHCESERLLMSVYGDIFDVSDRPDKYGKDGPYYYFAGADISYGLATGRDDIETINKFYDLWKMPSEQRDQKLQCICAWIGFYEKEYGQPVGRLEVFDRERHLPAPPVGEENCTVM
eukprot:TRINITY_DN50558_c0_g1_i1.p1 TRINITY_DN50558_c0_g1~~TRINITY_DN50558_c0_g1_i1.p1  ORF type:complete len:409 (+),score=106.99 TRINITY_DN50558_c0_g1_i1:143-1369(+)